MNPDPENESAEAGKPALPPRTPEEDRMITGFEIRPLALRDRLFALPAGPGRREAWLALVKQADILTDDMLDLPEPRRTHLMKLMVELRDAMRAIRV